MNPKSAIRHPQSFDVIIIGGGAAGMSAALWCDELGLSALLLEEQGELGGQLLSVYNPIENHLGARTANGRKMRDAFLEQIADRRFDVLLGAKLAAADLEKKTVELATGENFSAKALVIATGVRRRRLGVAGEREFEGRGLLRSGNRDRGSAAGRRVVIVGGGDAAVENALILTETAAAVTIVHRRREFRARSEFLEQARREPKISFITPAAVTGIFGGETIEKIAIENLETGETASLPADAVLPRIGVVPNTEPFAGKLSFDEKGYITVDAECRTNLPGVYAVGDVANPTAPTVSTAVGTGASAVKSIHTWLSS